MDIVLVVFCIDVGFGGGDSLLPLGMMVLCRFIFGFGLSYSEFEYGPAMYDRNDKNVLVVPVTNAGNMDGSEVVQLYVQSRYSRQLRPIIQLVDFQKVFIEKGKTVDVLFDLDELKNRGNLNFDDSDQLVWAIGKSSRELVRKLGMG